MKCARSLALAAVSAAVLASAAPSHNHDQIFFGAGNGDGNVLDAAGREAAAYLKEASTAINQMTGHVGTVVQKGANWIKDHVNDPRFVTVSHAEFPRHKLRVNTKSPSLCDPDVKQISGYLDIDSKKHLFFWFFESRRNPKKDPLTMWLNGGPGCSSTTGLLFELGPCLIASNGTKTRYNPHSWNEVSSMIFLDQPVAVGYSYTEGQNVVTTADAAVDVYAFLQLFMKSFPEYASLDFNIAGESYGGTYIPNFASYIHDHTSLARAGQLSGAKEEYKPINLKSLLIGNGLTDPYYQFASVPEYACEPSKFAFLDDSQCTTLKNKVPTCQRLQKYCYDSPSRFTCVPAALYCWGMYSPMQATGRNLYDIRKPCNRDGEDGPLCYKEMGWIETYLNQAEIKEELGVPQQLNFASCNFDVNRAFLMTGDSQHNSAAFLPPLLADGIRVLIYAGDEDAMCNFMGNKEWFLALESVFSKDIQKGHERDYKFKDSKAGRIISAGPQHTAGNYTFLQIFEAGHMVPTDQPAVALDMFSKWLDNKAF